MFTDGSKDERAEGAVYYDPIPSFIMIVFLLTIGINSDTL